MEQTVRVFIYIHAFLGGIGLIAGIASIIVKKGDKTHKKLGKLFTISILLSTLISTPICMLPNHKNLFLFLIGLFTMYLLITGNRALRFKKRLPNRFDYSVSTIMLILSGFMLSRGVFFSEILYMFFGAIGLFLTLRDFRFYKKLKHKKHLWLLAHIGKMSGALIASFTAFLVAGAGINGNIIWIAPSIVGTFFIIYWSKKVSPKKAN